MVPAPSLNGSRAFQLITAEDTGRPRRKSGVGAPLAVPAPSLGAARLLSAQERTRLSLVRFASGKAVHRRTGGRAHSSSAPAAPAFDRQGCVGTTKGILLAWLLAIGLPAPSIAIAVVRGCDQISLIQEATKHVGNTLADFAQAIVLSSARSDRLNVSPVIVRLMGSIPVSIPPAGACISVNDRAGLKNLNRTISGVSA